MFTRLAGVFNFGQADDTVSAMRIVLIALLVVACADAETRMSTLRCTDCPEVQVVRVIDGDNLGTSRGRVRLFGVDTPERRERCASEATARLQKPASDLLRLEDRPREADPFGRLPT